MWTADPKPYGDYLNKFLFKRDERSIEAARERVDLTLKTDVVGDDLT
jgi:hypothetical protein